MERIGYSEKVMDHFRNPRNVGVIEDHDGYGKVGNPTCGDVMEIFLKITDDGRIEDIKFRTFGCGSAIATTSMTTEMAKGKTLDEAKALTRNDVAQELDGLPPVKMHCSNLAADALHAAIEDYYERKKNGSAVPDDGCKKLGLAYIYGCECENQCSWDVVEFGRDPGLQPYCCGRPMIRLSKEDERFNRKGQPVQFKCSCESGCTNHVLEFEAEPKAAPHCKNVEMVVLQAIPHSCSVPESNEDSE